jgi:hypothetical protein
MPVSERQIVEPGSLGPIRRDDVRSVILAEFVHGTIGQTDADRVRWGLGAGHPLHQIPAWAARRTGSREHERIR